MISDMQEFYDGYEEFQPQKLLQNEERESIEDTASESYSKEAVETAAAIEAENGMDASEYILPDSDTRCLTEEDVAGLSEDEIRIALNEIYARHGRIFQSEDLNAYFASRSWYEPKYSAEEFSAVESSIMKDCEIKTIDLLAEVRDGKNGSEQVFVENGM